MSEERKSMSSTTKTTQVRAGGPGGPMSMMGGAKAKDLKGTLKRLIQYLNVFKMKIILVIIFAIASSAFGI